MMSFCKNHCYHNFRGPIWMVIPDGHVVQKCCKCNDTIVVHIEHTNEYRRHKKFDSIKSLRNKYAWINI